MVTVQSTVDTGHEVYMLFFFFLFFTYLFFTKGARQKRSYLADIPLRGLPLAVVDIAILCNFFYIWTFEMYVYETSKLRHVKWH